MKPNKPNEDVSVIPIISIADSQKDRKIKKIKKKNKKAKNKDDTPKANVFLQTKDYLSKNYDFRNNVLKCEIEGSDKGKDEFEQVNDSSLFVELQEKNIKISQGSLRAVLRSDFAPIHDPLKDYFERLEPYNPESDPDYIGLFSSYVTADDQEGFNKHHKMWLVRAVRCALDPNYYNKQAFILVHDKQDSGKSSYCRFHCPTALKDYLAEEISTDKDGLILLAKNFIINLDELSTLHKSEINSLKSYFSKDRINVRLPYDAKNTNIVRKCSFVGSTNKGEFLQDETGSVRWLCFNISSINWSYRQEVNIDDVWRQAFFLWQSDTFAYEMKREDIAQNEERNRQFAKTTNESDLVAKYFCKPENTDDSSIEFMQVVDVRIYLQQSAGISVSSEYLGRALKAQGFQRVRKFVKEKGFQIYGYLLKKDVIHF